MHKLVVNKVGEIHEEYRTFDMEILASSFTSPERELNPFMVSIQHLCSSLQFDFSKTYWNSRLNTEHERIVTFILEQAASQSHSSSSSSSSSSSPSSYPLVLDLCAGVGPFSIPLSNPSSYYELVCMYSCLSVWFFFRLLYFLMFDRLKGNEKKRKKKSRQRVVEAKRRTGRGRRRRRRGKLSEQYLPSLFWPTT